MGEIIKLEDYRKRRAARLARSRSAQPARPDRAGKTERKVPRREPADHKREEADDRSAD